MALRNAVRSSFRRGSSRGVTWVGGADLAAYFAVAAASKVLNQTFTPGSGNFDAPFTIVRTRGIVSIRTDQVVAAEEQIGALGFLVGNDQAIGVGATALPGPIVNIDSDKFFVWQPLAASNTLLSSVGFEPQMATTWTFDSKAMRKVKEGEGVAVMFENAHATHGFEAWLQFRMLIKFGAGA